MKSMEWDIVFTKVGDRFFPTSYIPDKVAIYPDVSNGYTIIRVRQIIDDIDSLPEGTNKGEEMKAYLISGIFVFILVFVAAMVGCPQYNVYEQRLAGEAELAKASYNRQTRVREAEAVKEASQSLADAEIIRAGGMAKANQIIGSSLKDNEAYLRWLYIEGLKEKQGQEIIYVPTEAGLPILEAGRSGRIKK